MDIIASIFAYLVCMTGIVTGLVLSLVVFFSDPNSQSAMPGQLAAMAAMPSAGKTPGKTVVGRIANNKQTDAQLQLKVQANAHVPPAAKADTPQAAIAIDARQKQLFSKSQRRRLAERARARHLAYRDRSSFETRFLHYDD